MLQQVIEHWTFSLFFCIAELWGAVVISVLFWTLANDVCTVADAKIIYPSLGKCVRCLPDWQASCKAFSACFVSLHGAASHKH